MLKAPAGRGAPAARGAPAKGAPPTAAKSNTKAEPEPAPAPEPEAPKPAPSAGPAPINRKTYHPRLGLARAHKAANEVPDAQKYYNEVIVMSPEVYKYMFLVYLVLFLFILSHRTIKVYFKSTRFAILFRRKMALFKSRFRINNQ